MYRSFVGPCLFKTITTYNYILGMKSLHMVTFILLVVGGVNWGLSALGFNIVSMLLGTWPMVEKAVYPHIQFPSATPCSNNTS
jgi:uncharacterized membrane protein YuzA (DUF378 family)